MQLMRLFILLFAILPFAASAADVYRCQINGRTEYQNKPCDAAATSSQLQAEPRSDLIGCYRPEETKSDTWRVARGTKSPFVLSSMTGDRKAEVPLKVASPAELTALSDGSIQFLSGLSVSWPPNATNTKPLGVYRVRERGGKEGFIALLYMSAGYVTPVKCDA